MSLLWGLMSSDTFWSDLALPQVAVARGQDRTANVSQQENGLKISPEKWLTIKGNMKACCPNRKPIRNLSGDDWLNSSIKI